MSIREMAPKKWAETFWVAPHTNKSNLKIYGSSLLNALEYPNQGLSIVIWKLQIEKRPETGNLCGFLYTLYVKFVENPDARLTSKLQ